MPCLDISVKNKIAVAMTDERIVCNNSDYTIRFAFDGEWEEHALKTVQFRWFRQGEGWKKHEEVISGDECLVPMLDNARWLYVGVYAGDLRTTTEAEIGCRLSALSGEGVPHDPPEDVYNQIMGKIDEAVTHSDETAKEAKEAARSAAASAGSAEAAAVSAEKISAVITKKADEAAAEINDAAEKAIADISSTAAAILSDTAGAVVCAESGEEISIDIAAARPIPSMHLFGRSTQVGTPYLLSQSPIIGIGEDGSVSLTITGGGVSNVVEFPLTEALHAVPTAYVGNYTDASGQAWIADEIDLVRGVLIRRTGELRLTGDEAWIHEDWIPYSGESLHATVRLAIGSTTSGVNDRELCSGAVWAPWRWEAATANSVIHYRDNMLRLGVRYDVLGITQSASSADKLGAVVARLKAAGVTVVRYALPSPVEEPLPNKVVDAFRRTIMPSGAAVIGAGGAWVDMQYIADTKGYIDKRFDELANAILGKG